MLLLYTACHAVVVVVIVVVVDLSISSESFDGGYPHTFARLPAVEYELSCDMVRRGEEFAPQVDLFQTRLIDGCQFSKSKQIIFKLK